MIINRLSEFMGKNRLKISDVVEITGLARNTVSELYHNRAKQVHFETLDKLCKGLKCDITDIIVYNPDDEVDNV